MTLKLIIIVAFHIYLNLFETSDLPEPKNETLLFFLYALKETPLMLHGPTCLSFVFILILAMNL